MSAEKSKTPQSGGARVLIVDDHELARAGLRSVLNQAAGLEIIGEVSNANDALAFCARLQPDLVLMDIRMPGLEGLDAITSIREVCPATRIVIVTIHGDPSLVVRAIAAGASGFVLKDATRKEILDAVRRVLQGETVLDPKLTFQLVQQLVTKPDSPAVPLVEQLTNRERDVLRLIVEGRTNPEIAAELGIGKGTVKSHVQRVIAKLGVADRTQAAVRAVQLGLIDIDRPPNYLADG
jgi:DNA-binding NarL/FixJ family response regulator